MRTLKKNQRSFYYYLYRDKVDAVDKDGYQTGEKVLRYHVPVECKGNISAGVGEKQVELFGSNVKYERVIIVDDINCPIDENSLLCVDIQPEPYNPNETPVHDYIVKAIAKSLNVFAIAISKEVPDEN